MAVPWVVSGKWIYGGAASNTFFVVFNVGIYLFYLSLIGDHLKRATWAIDTSVWSAYKKQS